jgi:4-amino-4-deoxy-L-arabinose transferase-like glycosyltransferase
MTPTKRHFIVAIACIVILLALFIGSRGLNEPDEGRYANIGASLLNPSVSWLEPRLSGYAHYDKPPLIYWVTALSFKAFGVNEWAARLPSLLGALMALGGVTWAAFRLYNLRTAWWTLVISASLAQFWLLARFLTPDMLLTGCCTLAVAAWAECRHRRGHWGCWLLSLLFWVLAWWTKATPALVPFIGLTLALLITKDRQGLQALRPLRMLAGIIVLGLPWYLYLVNRYPDLLDFFLHRQMVGHIAGGAEARKSPLWYYWVLSPAFWLPWSLLLAGLLLRCNRRKDANDETNQPWFAVSGWLVLIGLFIFTLNGSKLPTYTLTLAPWTGLVLARLFVRYASDRWQKTALTATLAFYVVLFGVFQFVYLPRYQAKIGANSSLQPVAEAVARQGAQTVILDRYWPSFELYFHGNVIYATSDWVKQRESDAMIIDSGRHVRFMDTGTAQAETLEGNNVWFVHYRKSSSKIKEFFRHNQPAANSETIGDFTIERLQ